MMTTFDWRQCTVDTRMAKLENLTDGNSLVVEIDHKDHS